MDWRYGCRRRTYQTILPDGTEQPPETLYELVEVYPDPFGYTEDAVTVAGDSKAGLVEWLRRAADDVEKSDVIVEIEPVIYKMGEE